MSTHIRGKFFQLDRVSKRWSLQMKLGRRGGREGSGGGRGGERGREEGREGSLAISKSINFVTHNVTTVGHTTLASWG